MPSRSSPHSFDLIPALSSPSPHPATALHRPKCLLAGAHTDRTRLSVRAQLPRALSCCLHHVSPVRPTAFRNHSDDNTANYDYDWNDALQEYYDYSYVTAPPAEEPSAAPPPDTSAPPPPPGGAASGGNDSATARPLQRYTSALIGQRIGVHAQSMRIPNALFAKQACQVRLSCRSN